MLRRDAQQQLSKQVRLGRRDGPVFPANLIASYRIAVRPGGLPRAHARSLLPQCTVDGGRRKPVSQRRPEPTDDGHQFAARAPPDRAMLRSSRDDDPIRPLSRLNPAELSGTWQVMATTLPFWHGQVAPYIEYQPLPDGRWRDPCTTRPPPEAAHHLGLRPA